MKKLNKENKYMKIIIKGKRFYGKPLKIDFYKGEVELTIAQLKNQLKKMGYKIIPINVNTRK